MPYDSRHFDERQFPNVDIEKEPGGATFRIRVGNGDRIIEGLSREQCSAVEEALGYAMGKAVSNTQFTIREALGIK